MMKRLSLLLLTSWVVACSIWAPAANAPADDTKQAVFYVA